MCRHKSSLLRYKQMGIGRIRTDEYLTRNAQDAMPAQCYHNNIHIVPDQDRDSDAERQGDHAH
jgi:hypothetical protein